MTNKIRIAYLIDTISSNKAGTEKQLINIIQRLDKDLFEVTLLCLYESPWMLSNRLPCEMISLGYRGLLKFGFAQVLRRYLQILKEKNVDVVQTFFEDSMFVGGLGKIIGKKNHILIVSRRDLGLGSDEPAYHRLFKILRPLIFYVSDSIAVNAHAIKINLTRYEKVRPEKIIVINNGIFQTESPGQLPFLLRDNQNIIWIGITANLKPVKRIDVFIRALAHLKKNKNVDEVKAVILGEGHLRSKLEQLAIDLDVNDRVFFMGSIDNISDYLQHIDIGVLCSDIEGLPNAILEYMACGLPVVATSVGGNCELVDESNGICVPPGDYMALGDALAKLISSNALRNNLGKRSLEKIRNGATWDVIMPQWVSYYSSLVHSKDN